jgi:hypothetical protein
MWVEVELELPHGVAAIGEEGNLLVELVALRLEHFEEPPFRCLELGLDEGKALTGDRLLGLLTSRERQAALASNDLKPDWLALGTHVAPIDAYRERAIGDRQATPLRRTAVDERPLLLPQRLLQPLRHGEDVLPNRAGGKRVIDRQHLVQELGGNPIGHQGGPLRLQKQQLRCDRFWQQLCQGTERPGRIGLTGTLIERQALDGDGAEDCLDLRDVIPLTALSVAAMRTDTLRLQIRR